MNAEQARETAQRLLTSRRDAELLEFSASAVEQFPQDAELRMIYATALMKFRPAEAPEQIALIEPVAGPQRIRKTQRHRGGIGPLALP